MHVSAVRLIVHRGGARQRASAASFAGRGKALTHSTGGAAPRGSPGVSAAHHFKPESGLVVRVGMKPLPADAKVLQLSDLLVTDMTFAASRCSPEHEHELPFVGIVLGGGLAKSFGRLSFSVGTAGVYVMPAGVPHVDSYPVGVRLLTLELELGSDLWSPCAGLLARVRRLRGPTLATLARQISVELVAEDDLRAIAVEGLSLELLVAATRSLEGARDRPKAPPWLNTVDELLLESFFRPLRIAEIAAAVHVHPAHLARVFRAHHGETIGHRIRRLRLDWAMSALVEGDLPIRDIATQAGFAHQSHFTRVFKAHTGASPARYRELRRRAA
jgi:AraC family transcriptional regulator